MPMTRSGRFAPSAIFAMGMADVLDAKMPWDGITCVRKETQPGGWRNPIQACDEGRARRTSSISLSTRCLTLSSSNTASMTMSAPAKCFFQLWMLSCSGMRRDDVSQYSWFVMRFFFSLP